MKKLVIGISGASGQIYALRFLKALPADMEAHVVFSQNAADIMKAECGWDIQRQTFYEFVQQKYSVSPLNKKIILHKADNFFSPLASGSFKTMGMIVIPASVKTLAGVASGYTNTLIERAADVTLKEKRPLLMVVRESPYNRIHLENMLKAQQGGAVILPASPSFYSNPQSIEDAVDTIVARAMDLLAIPQDLVPQWGWQDE